MLPNSAANFSASCGREIRVPPEQLGKRAMKLGQHAVDQRAAAAMIGLEHQLAERLAPSTSLRKNLNGQSA